MEFILVYEDGTPIATKEDAQKEKIAKLSRVIKLLTGLILTDNESENSVPEILNALLIKFDTRKEYEAQINKNTRHIEFPKRAWLKYRPA